MTATAATPTTDKPQLNITPPLYEALAGSPIRLPTQRQLFDYQVGVWARLGLATHADLLPLAEFIPATGLFVVVPKRPDPLDLGVLMSAIVLNGTRGANHLDPAQITDEIKVPKGPYLMLDVEDGRSRLNTKPSVSEANILKEGRSPYVNFEGIAHGTVFPHVLLHHNMDLCGSRYRSRIVPGLRLDGGLPGLSASWDGGAVPGWGAPSCGSRVGA